MKIKCCSFDEMAKKIIEENLKIIMIGVGVIGTITSPNILSQYNLINTIECFIDSDSRVSGSTILIGEKSIKIYTIEHLKKIDSNSVIFLNISRYAEILEVLENMECTKNMTCFIIPMMCIHNFKTKQCVGAIKTSSAMLIPKRIHYMWLGGNPIPDNLQNCINTWRRFCPDYEIIRWDETNYDIKKNDYMMQAYEKKAYGFIPDYARLDILYNYGGIYMDTDVEVIKPLDDLLYQEAFCGVEKWQVINFGGCSGSIKGHRALQVILQERKDIKFINEDGSQNRKTCGFYDTDILMKHGYKINGTNQNILDMNIYTSDYFHPYDYMSGQTEVTENTFSIHRFNGGWLDDEMRLSNKKTAREFNKLYQKAQKVDI